MSTALLESRLPIVAAPMAGGPTTPALSAAVARAGAFPVLPAGYLTPERLAEDIAQARELGSPFGVNLFVPGPVGDVAAQVAAYAAAIQPEADRYDLRLDPEPVSDDDHWSTKLALLLQDPVPVVSLTFGLPAAEDVAALQRVGTRVLATVTTPDEARAAADLGVDGLVVQGPDAGGHSGTHDPARTPEPARTVEVLTAVRAAVDLPLVAAGGVDGPAAVAELLAAGAEAVVVGTLLLRTDEAGTSATHRAALADNGFDETLLTCAFTGRPARALLNRFADTWTDRAPVAYPAVHHLTRGLRKAASAAGDADMLHLWAGTGYRQAPEGPAAEVVAWLAKDLP